VAIAIVAEVSTISIALHGAGMLLPIARFAGYAWLIAAAALLPRNRLQSGAASTPSGTGRVSSVLSYDNDSQS
jgi:hypothetical protein